MHQLRFILSREEGKQPRINKCDVDAKRKVGGPANRK